MLTGSQITLEILQHVLAVGEHHLTCAEGFLLTSTLYRGRLNLSARIAAPDLVALLVHDQERDDIFVSCQTFMDVASRSQAFVVQTIKAAEDNLTQHLERVLRLLEIWGPQDLAEVVAVSLLGWPRMTAWPERHQIIQQWFGL